ncbi:Major Facilitator Superfamily (MFS), partial [Thraustotheca clavata]
MAELSTPVDPSTRPDTTPKTANEDAYIAIKESPKDDGLDKPRASVSWRSQRRSQSRSGRLSRLEAMIHEEHAKALIPMPILYVTIAVALMGSFQFGWLLSETNYRPFNVGCDKDSIPDKECIIFPHHTDTEWTMGVTAWIVGGIIGACFSGIPADKFGRQKSLLFNAIIMIIGGAIQASATEIYQFAVGRIFSGLASGAAINIANVLISEISPTQMRGMFATGLQVGAAFGS